MTIQETIFIIIYINIIYKIMVNHIIYDKSLTRK